MEANKTKFIYSIQHYLTVKLWTVGIEIELENTGDKGKWRSDGSHDVRYVDVSNTPVFMKPIEAHNIW